MARRRIGPWHRSRPARCHLDFILTELRRRWGPRRCWQKSYDHGWHTGLFANVTVFFVRGLNQGMYVRDYKTSDYTVHGAKPGSEFLTDQLLAHVDRWSDKSLKVKRDKFYIWGHYYDPMTPISKCPAFPVKIAVMKRVIEPFAVT